MASLRDLDITNEENALQGKDVNAQTGTTYDLVAEDAGKIITLSNGSAIALTVPANADVAFPIGTKIELWQIGAGAVTVAGDVGVTVNAVGGTLVFSAQYQRGVLEKRDTNTWIFDLATNASGFVPTSRTVNGEALSGNITLVLASDDFANQGTTTTVLHGNAAGNPAFGAVVEADITLADNTTNNVSTTKHGFAPKASNVATEYLDGTGAWSVPVGSGGIPDGTSFPGSPSTDDLFHRTDLNLIFFYDGTRWLTINQYTVTFIPYSALGTTAMSATSTVRMMGYKPCDLATDFWIETAIVNGIVATTNNGTNYWRFDFVADSGGGSTVTVANPQTGTEPWTAAAYGLVTSSPGVLWGTTAKVMYLNCVKVLSPGNLNIYSAQLVGRIVGT